MINFNKTIRATTFFAFNLKSIEIGVCHDEGKNWGQSIVKETDQSIVNSIQYAILFILEKGFLYRKRKRNQQTFQKYIKSFNWNREKSTKIFKKLKRNLNLNFSLLTVILLCCLVFPSANEINNINSSNAYILIFKSHCKHQGKEEHLKHDAI